MRAIDAEDRYAPAITMFRSLGDVVHLVEDMGQPQHTRTTLIASINTDQQQAFEGYTNARVLGGNVTSTGTYVRSFFPDTSTSALPDLVLGNYPAVMFSRPERNSFRQSLIRSIFACAAASPTIRTEVSSLEVHCR